jgi:hypothetical protein
VNQIVDLTQLSTFCQGKVSPTTEVIMECACSQLGGSWEEVEAELVRAAEGVRISSYSDQVLVNFFEVLVQYRNAESNPNGEGVIEYFLYIADNMLMLVQEPLLRGFIFSLKGMIESLGEGEAQSIKLAMLLCPAATKPLVQSK